MRSNSMAHAIEEGGTLTKDTLIVPISDLHSGGTTALFPKRFWQFEHGNHTPTKEQKDMFTHWSKCADEISKVRKDKKLIVVHNGDAIDGVHHNSLEIVTRLKNEQIEIHVDLMDYFIQKVGGVDELYYTIGTEVHTNDSENLIGNDLGAVKNGDNSAFDELKLTINGRNIWFTHHGPSTGKGANRGNTLRNWLKNTFYDQIAEGEKLPDFVVSSHTHDPDWNDYIGRVDGRYHKVHGLITPSWQQKTRYALGRVPLKKNKIGLQYFIITKEGFISDPVERLMV